MSKRIVGWRVIKMGSKNRKQHLFRLDYNGDIYQHCHGTYPDVLAIGGTSTIEVPVDCLVINHKVGRCKKCEKEVLKLENIGIGVT